jgi:predicted nuclease with RNAse H fold
MKYEYIIGIDPDVDKSGIAIYNTGTKQIKLFNLSFPELIEKLTEVQLIAWDYIVVIEAGWLNSSNWHLPTPCTNKMAASIGNRTGRNHQTGILLVEMLKFKGINVVEKKPIQKIGGKKISAEMIKKIIPNFTNSSNQETRDAAMIAFTF